MPIRTTCQCGKVISAPDNLAGKRVKGPGCGLPLAVPTGAAAAAPTAAAPTRAPHPAQPGMPQPGMMQPGMPHPGMMQPGMGYPGMQPGSYQQPMHPAAFSGVGDLINEEITRQVKGKIKAEEDALDQK